MSLGVGTPNISMSNASKISASIRATTEANLLSKEVKRSRANTTVSEKPNKEFS